MTSAQNRPTLYFILPVYNESRSIFSLLTRLNELSEDVPYTVCAIPIDDASKDDSQTWIQKAIKTCDKISITPLLHQTNKGLPGALNTGLTHIEKLIRSCRHLF